MNKLFVLLAACLMFSSINVEAQINLGKLKNKVKEKVSGESSESTTNQNSSANNTQNTSTNNSQNSSTNNSQNNNKKAEADPFAPVKDYGMTDEIHANHKKQVVFSKTSIEFKRGKEEQLSNTFNLGDEIYIMAYFEHSMMNQALKDKFQVPDRFEGFLNVWYEVNGQVVGKEGNNSFEKKIYDGSAEFENWTGICYPLHSLSLCDNFNRDNIQLAFHSYVVPMLKQGDNKVKMFFSYELHEAMDPNHGGYSGDLKKELKLIYQPAEPIAVGEMTIKVNNIADVKKMLTKSGFIPVAGQSNPALEKQIMNIYNAGGTEKKAVKVIIYSNDWSIRRDDFGNILGRYVGVNVVATTSDPNYYEVWDKSAEQQYTGGGQYSTKIVLSNYTTPNYTISSSLFK